jgi:hypothetical protein
MMVRVFRELQGRLQLSFYSYKLFCKERNVFVAVNSHRDFC